MLVQGRIVSNPDVCSGKPTIRGTRIMVRNVLSMMRGGYDIDRVLAAYPELAREDVEACLDLATELIEETRVYPRAA